MRSLCASESREWQWTPRRRVTVRSKQSYTKEQYSKWTTIEWGPSLPRCVRVNVCPKFNVKRATLSCTRRVDFGQGGPPGERQEFTCICAQWSHGALARVSIPDRDSKECRVCVPLEAPMRPAPNGAESKASVARPRRRRTFQGSVQHREGCNRTLALG